MNAISYCVSTFDVGSKISSTADFEALFFEKIRASIQRGERLFVFPEYSAYILAQVFAHSDPKALARDISNYYWNTFAPKVVALSKESHALICAGSAPCFEPETQQFFNRTLIACDGILHTYDKQQLTPWESDFTPGSKFTLFEWQGLKIAVLICFDIEFPEIIAKLKNEQIHLLICPSATSDVLGSERIQRCASAAAVQLGCAVMVSALVGTDLNNPLVDINEGQCSVYLPSQQQFQREISTTSKGIDQSPYIKDGFFELTGVLPIEQLIEVKKPDFETKPFLDAITDMHPSKIS